MQPMQPMRLANAADVANAGNPANGANPASVANAVLRQIAVPPRRDAAVLLRPALVATNSLASEASGKGVWRATAGPEKAFEIIEGPRRPSLTDREQNRPAFPQLRWRRSAPPETAVLPCVSAKAARASFRSSAFSRASSSARSSMRDKTLIALSSDKLRSLVTASSTCIELITTACHQAGRWSTPKPPLSRSSRQPPRASMPRKTCHPRGLTGPRISPAEPVLGFEPRTDGLQNRCSTTELNWRPRGFGGVRAGNRPLNSRLENSSPTADGKASFVGMFFGMTRILKKDR